MPRLAARIPHRSISGIRNSIERLGDHGLVFRRDVGRTRLYSFNDDHLLAPAIRSIADAKRLLLRRLQELVESWEFPPLFGALFGSAARGNMHLDSDIDLFLVVPIVSDHDWDDDTGELISAVNALTGNDTRVIELYEKEVVAPQHRPLVDAVLREGIPFTDDVSWLRKAVVGGAAA